MISNGLILLIYVLILMDGIFHDDVIAIRYLHFSYLALFLLSTLLLLYLVLRHPRKSLWFLPAFLVISLHFFQPFAASEKPLKNSINKASSLRILSFSVNSRNDHYADVARLLKQYPADILCLQEVPYSRYSRFISELHEAGVNYHYVYSRLRALMILSRFPLTPNKTLPFLQATTTLPAPWQHRVLKIWNIHAPKALTQKHYQDFYFKHLRQDIEHDPSPLKLVCGDFNATPHNDILQTFVPGFQPAYHYAEQPLLFTYPTPAASLPTPFPVLKIDYILLSSHFSIDRYTRLTQYAHSDHYPIMAVVHLRTLRE